MTSSTLFLIGAISSLSLVSVQAETSLEEAIPTDLGTYGVVYPIKERSLLAVLKEKMESEDGKTRLRALEEDFKQAVRKGSSLPKPVEGLTPTSVHGSYLFDPSISVAQDLSDHQGSRFYKAGDILNPLDHMTLSKDYLFIDGDRPLQVAWAKSYQRQKKSMIILVKGNPLAVMKDHDLTVYFDQEGVMAQRFQLKHVPCSLTQEGKSLRITEWVEEELQVEATAGVNPKEKKDEAP